MARNDVHSPKNFQPQDYEYVDHFGFMTVQDPDSFEKIQEAYGEEVMHAYDDQGGADNPHEDKFQCDLCGTQFVHGAGLIHKPSGLLITVGGQCMENLANIPSLSRGQKWNRVNREKKSRERIKRMRDLLAGNPGLNAALKTDHYISEDLRARVLQWGSLSEKQVALAFKLQRDVANRPAELTPMPIPNDDKRREVEAIILGVSVKETAYGPCEKMLLSVQVEGGAFKLYGTVPQGIVDAQWAEHNMRQALWDDKIDKAITKDMSPAEASIAYKALNAEMGQTVFMPSLKGARIKFMAKLERSRDDECFGFFKRPTKAVVISWGE